MTGLFCNHEEVTLHISGHQYFVVGGLGVGKGLRGGECFLECELALSGEEVGGEPGVRCLRAVPQVLVSWSPCHLHLVYTHLQALRCHGACLWVTLPPSPGLHSPASPQEPRCLSLGYLATFTWSALTLCPLGATLGYVWFILLLSPDLHPIIVLSEPRCQTRLRPGDPVTFTWSNPTYCTW